MILPGLVAGLPRSSAAGCQGFVAIYTGLVAICPGFVAFPTGLWRFRGLIGDSRVSIGDLHGFIGDSRASSSDLPEFSTPIYVVCPITGVFPEFCGATHWFRGDSHGLCGDLPRFCGDSAGFTGDSRRLSRVSHSFTRDLLGLSRGSNFTVPLTFGGTSIRTTKKSLQQVVETFLFYFFVQPRPMAPSPRCVPITGPK